MQMLDVRVRMYLYRWSRHSASRSNFMDPSEPFQMVVSIRRKVCSVSSSKLYVLKSLKPPRCQQLQFRALGALSDAGRF